MLWKRSEDEGNDLQGLDERHVLGAAPASLRDELVDQGTLVVRAVLLVPHDAEHDADNLVSSLGILF